MAARDMACCPFLHISAPTVDGQVWWDASVVDDVDDDIACTVLDDLYTLPDTVGAGVARIEERLAGRDLDMTWNASATIMRVHRATTEV